MAAALLTRRETVNRGVPWCAEIVLRRRSVALHGARRWRPRAIASSRLPISLVAALKDRGADNPPDGRKDLHEGSASHPPASRVSIAPAACRCMDSVTWLYRSKVIATVECPSISEAILGWTP